MDDWGGRWVRILGGFVLGIFVVLLVLFFAFPVQTVEVLGTTRYTPEEVKELVMTGPGAANTLLAPILLSRDEMIEEMPYIDSISVERTSSTGLSINVKEKKAIGCVPYLDSFLYFDRNGVYVIGGKTRDETVPYFSGVKINHVVQNEKMDLTNSSIVPTAVILSTIFQKNELQPDAVAFDEQGQILLEYADVTVNLGTQQNIENKMNRAMAILPKIKNMSGILHLEGVTDTDQFITFEKVRKLTPEEKEALKKAQEEAEKQRKEAEEKAENEDSEEEDTEDVTADEDDSEDDKPDEDENDDGKKKSNGKITLEYLDSDGDGFNDFTGDPITDRSLNDLVYLDEDEDGYNDFTGEPMPGTEEYERAMKEKEEEEDESDSEEDEYEDEEESEDEEDYEEDGEESDNEEESDESGGTRRNRSSDDEGEDDWEDDTGEDDIDDWEYDSEEDDWDEDSEEYEYDYDDWNEY
ncbi:MAG: FtsQ-type POTRA domain-containing protein [Blautia sp.]|nr:FtsQ-type POTRA domain-containing protein [Blautia sp.]